MQIGAKCELGACDNSIREGRSPKSLSNRSFLFSQDRANRGKGPPAALIFLVWLAIKRTDSGEAELRFMTQTEALGER